MATIPKNKKGLTLETAPRIHRKYLGEPDDPHFVPSSPIIERAVFTEQEESNLKRLCALALANVPHSDEPEPAGAPIMPPVRRPAGPMPKEHMKPPQPQFSDTRTPSEASKASKASKRDTLDTPTETCTPQTSAGITPGELAKRFSDPNARATSSKGLVPSNLRFDQWQNSKRGKSNTHSAPAKPPPLQPVDPRRAADFRKSASTVSPPTASAEKTLRFVSPSPRHASGSNNNDDDDSDDAPPPMSARLSQPWADSPYRRSHRERSAERPAESNSNRYSQAELNKQLPPLPRADSSKSDGALKTAPIGRTFLMIKTLHRKKSNIQDEDCEPLTGTRASANKQPHLQQTRSAPPSPMVDSEALTHKKKLLRFFARKERIDPRTSIAVP
jgi:hypothetical protein